MISTLKRLSGWLVLATAPVLAQIGQFEAGSDIGVTPRKGAATYDAASGEYRITGGGANMWGGTDAFHFVYRRLAGDFTISARLSFEGAGVNAHRKAVLIARQELTSGSAYADAALHGDGLVSLQYRPEAGAATKEFQAAARGAAWLRLERRGDLFTLSASRDGAAWQSAGPAVAALDGPVYAGLGVCSHDENVLESARFSQVRVEKHPARGPLRVLASNPRYFTAGDGRAVLLTGSHTWANLQDNGLIIKGAVENPPRAFDYPAYLDFLERHHHNFFRLWRWETTRWTDNYTGAEVKYCRPHPWLRTGPGAAADGEPRFDLSKFDEAYFARLRERVRQAGERGIYAAVMLFEAWEIQFSDAWANHPFHAPNNVNGVEADADGDGKALEYNSLVETAAGRRALALQEAYVRKVIDTVSDLDNVLYEIANEAHSGSTAWQYHFIRFVKQYEAGKPKQHPVGMTFQYRGGANAALFDSPADWISPNPGSPAENYREKPCADCTKKVVVNDTDHLWGHTGGDNVWVWRSFTRGLNVLFMEELLPSPVWQDSARAAMGQVRAWSQRIDLAAMTPSPKLCETGYCLAAPGREYLVFQNDKGEFTVDLRNAPGRFAVEWFDVNRNRYLPAAPVEGGAVRRFTTPFPGPAALYLKKID